MQADAFVHPRGRLRLVDFDVDRNIVRVEHKGVQLTVDRELVPGLQVQRGSLFQFIGEVTHVQVRAGTRQSTEMLRAADLHRLLCCRSSAALGAAATTAAGACGAGCRRDGPRPLRYGSGDIHHPSCLPLTHCPTCVLLATCGTRLCRIVLGVQSDVMFVMLSRNRRRAGSLRERWSSPLLAQAAPEAVQCRCSSSVLEVNKVHIH